MRVHRFVVTAASPVFKAMLGSQMAESLTASVSIDAEPADVLTLLQFMYLGVLVRCCPQTFDVIMNVKLCDCLNCV